MFSIIVAMDNNMLIGNQNKLPWYLPNDLKRVKELTTGQIIVMGRKNYESIGRPLSNRQNIILTRNISYTANGCKVIHSIDDILALDNKNREIFIFGGSEIYKIFLPYVTSMYITKINHSFEGDTHFPWFDRSRWLETSYEEGKQDEKNNYQYSFRKLERIY